MAQSKRKSTTRRTTRGKTTSKGQTSSQSRTKKAPSKAALRQLAKDWDHVT